MCRRRSIPHVYANEPACLTLLPRCMYEPAVSGGCHHNIQQNALQTVVGNSIDKYTRSTPEPPFSAVELVALAWLRIEMVPMPMVREDILWWILAEFDYYRMIDEQLDDDSGLSQSDHRDLLVVPGLAEVYAARGLPFATINLEKLE
ncbi:hypothetical protein B0A55_05908 [Friedmanniomyces simplex]|uniref:Uncharacterized protein n=1 Tax=Friedmanniomyces simplex TaxID=329884 RepID=A0A4U0XFP6_9PEZI|nr:hypothetical protein B0A55_05908 [Friedmanniomyces simplex]